MNNDINLLITRPKKDLAKLAKKLKMLRMFAMAFLFLIASTSIILFIFISTSPLPALKQQENTALINLATLHTRMGKLLLVQDQMKDISLITTKRTTFDMTYTEISSVLPDGMQLESFRITKQAVSLSLSSSALSDIDAYLTSLKDLAEKKKLFSSVTLSGFALNKQLNKYIFFVELATGAK